MGQVIFILDTSIIIDLIRGQPTREILEILEKQSYVTTYFSFYEVLRGAFPHEQSIIRSFFHHILVLPFDQSVIEQSVILDKELQKAGRKLAAIDLFIAATCKAAEGTLVTLDNDFANIPGLQAYIP